MGTNQYQLQLSIANPYQIVMNVSCLFVLDPLLSAERPGQTYTVKLVMFACSKYCVFFIFSFMHVLINANQTRRQISETEGTALFVF